MLGRECRNKSSQNSGIAKIRLIRLVEEKSAWQSDLDTLGDTSEAINSWCIPCTYILQVNKHISYHKVVLDIGAQSDKGPQKEAGGGV